MAGIPPMLGFVGKFLLFLFFLLKQNFYIAFLFTFINFFIMYFYIQNIRFLVTKNSSYYFLLKNFFSIIDFSLIIFLIFLNFFNFFGIFFFNDFLLFFLNFSNFMFLD
jgi:NADH:ubiquinone oxidoreductase subunit 2 (subunit N)